MKLTESQKGMGKLEIGLLVGVMLIILAGVALLNWYGNQNNAASSGGNFFPQESAGSPQASNGSQIKTFDISSKNFEYSQKEVRVKKGDRVMINLMATEGMHDLVVDGYDARTNVIRAGENSSLEFVADRTGKFEYYCSIGNHRQMGMVGKLIVEE